MMDMRNISILPKTKCYGCSTCVHSCSFHSIEMVRDQEGFLYPVVDKSKCTDCGKCMKVCPALNEKEHTNKEEPSCYALWAENRVRMGSSSGGAFTLLAKAVISEGGVVCGAAMDRDFQVHHTFVSEEKELEPLRGSKYVQSNLGNVFPKIREYLKQGRKVFFVGTPCQVAGLKNYLGNDRNEKLLLADLVCHGTISQNVFDRYLEETFGKENVRRFKFRPKKYGYNCSTTEAVLKDGQVYMGSAELDPLERGLAHSLFLKKTCGDCKFAELPRQGDITIGDFWGISQLRPELNDGRGTSLVLINSRQGEKYLEILREKAQVLEEMPLDKAVAKNRFRPKTQIHPQRDRFYEMLTYTSMHKAVKYCMDNRYDVGLLGVWFGCNYGSIATYYGLKCQLEQMGLSVLMIDKPGYPETDREVSEDNHSRIFAKTHFHVSKRYKLHEMRILNQICDSFVIGSDQVWNYGVGKNFGKSFLLDFARDEKKMVSVAASFGHNRDFRSDRERIIAAELFKRFDAISVREESAVDILQKVFHVDSTQVLDPVFSTDREIYDNISAESDRVETEPYILTYILDPTPEKKAAIRHISQKLGMRTLHILDGLPWTFQENKEKMDMDTVLENIQFQDWVYYFKNSSYVITDSCHGMSFAIIYRKPFAGIGNVRRGMTRFHSLTHLFHLENRLVTDPEDIIKNEEFLRPIDYSQVDQIMEREKKRSKEWLYHAMFSPKEIKTYQAFPVSAKPIEAGDEKIKLHVPAQVKQTLPRKVYNRLPASLQNKAKKFVKKYVPGYQSK